MKVFVSWSKPLSHEIAELLREWLPDVIQEIETWVSTEDIAKGQRWNAEVSAALDETRQGVFCVTQENVGEAWLNFEAGAIAKSVQGSLARPVLIDLRPSQVTGPLAQFQATTLLDQADMWRLFASLNESCAQPLSREALRRSFDRTWPEYSSRAQDIITGHRQGTDEADAPIRSETSIIEELLDRVRQIERMLSSVIVQSDRPVGRPANLDYEYLRRVWPEILNTVGRLSAPTRALLSKSTVVSVDKDTVTITIEPYEDLTRFEEGKHARYLTKAIAVVTGGEWSISVAPF
jgi:hypothetical protein